MLCNPLKNHHQCKAWSVVESNWHCILLKPCSSEFRGCTYWWRGRINSSHLIPSTKQHTEQFFRISCWGIIIQINSYWFVLIFGVCTSLNQTIIYTENGFLFLLPLSHLPSNLLCPLFGEYHFHSFSFHLDIVYWSCVSDLEFELIFRDSDSWFFVTVFCKHNMPHSGMYF